MSIDQILRIGRRAVRINVRAEPGPERAEIAAREQRVDQRESGIGTIPHGNRHRAIEQHDGRGIGPGEHFVSADTAPPGAVFDPAVHGHWSRQVGDEPLQTLFVRG